MPEYKLRTTSDEYGERGHCWIEKDGVSIDIEDLLSDVEELQELAGDLFVELVASNQTNASRYMEEFPWLQDYLKKAWEPVRSEP